MAVKCTISGIGWNPEYRGALQDLVKDVNELTTHAYLFARFLFIRELHHDPTFDLEHFVTKDFFVEVFLSLTTRTPIDSRASNRTLEYKQLIRSGLPMYRMLCGFRPIQLPNAQQIALYQANTIVTCYLNVVMNGFGQQFRRIINRVLDVKNRAQRLKTELAQQGASQDTIKAQVEQEVYGPARQFKLAIAQRPIDVSSIPHSMTNTLNKMQPVLNAYAGNYQFSRNSIYYDSQAHPEKHVLAYFRMSQLCEIEGITGFQSFPLRNSFIPGYMQIDTLILRRFILHERNDDLSLSAKLNSWSKVVDINSRAFKAQGPSHQTIFRGSIQTDGIGVTILKTTSDTRAGGPRRQKLRSNVNEPSVSDLSQEEVRSTEGQCVLVDPNRRDLLYSMHEHSTAEQPLIFRYTKNTQAKQRKERKYRDLHNSIKQQTPIIFKAEAKLGQFARSTTSPYKFSFFLIARSKVSAILANFYSNTPNLNVQNPVPLHRKLRLSAIINRNREDDRLATAIKNSFGRNCVLIWGNWSATTTKFHEPIRGIGMRRALRKRGITILMLDEYNTSKHCPACTSKSLETFKRVPNPRPWRRQTRPTVLCNGLLRCTNQNCRQPLQSARLYNRDLVAACNFRYILQSLRLDGTRPPRFCRTRRQTNPR